MSKRALSGAISNYEEVLAVPKDLALGLAWPWNHSFHLNSGNRKPNRESVHRRDQQHQRHDRFIG
jgi:hypothetical protein